MSLNRTDLPQQVQELAEHHHLQHRAHSTWLGTWARAEGAIQGRPLLIDLSAGLFTTCLAIESPGWQCTSIEPLFFELADSPVTAYRQRLQFKQAPRIRSGDPRLDQRVCFYSRDTMLTHTLFSQEIRSALACLGNTCQQIEIDDRHASLLLKNRRDRSPETLPNAVDAFLLLLNTLQQWAPDARTRLLQNLRSEQDNERKLELMYLLGTRFPMTDATVEVFVELLQDENPAVQRRAAHHLWQKQPMLDTTVAALCAVLSSTDGQLRLEAIAALEKGAPHSPLTRQAMRGIARHSDPKTRCEAIRVLALPNAPDDLCRDILQHALSDPVEEVALLAVEQLGRFAEQDQASRTILLSVLQLSATNVRLAAIRRLSPLVSRDKQVRDSLQALFQARWIAIRLEAARALGMDSLPDLVHSLFQDRKLNTADIEQALRHVARFPGAVPLNLLEELYREWLPRHPENIVVINALLSLFQTWADPASHVFLLEQLPVTDYNCLQAMYGAAGVCCSLEAVPVLLQLEKEERSPWLRERIRSAIARIQERCGGGKGWLSVQELAAEDGGLSLPRAAGDGSLSTAAPPVAKNKHVTRNGDPDVV